MKSEQIEMLPTIKLINQRFMIERNITYEYVSLHYVFCSRFLAGDVSSRYFIIHLVCLNALLPFIDCNQTHPFGCIYADQCFAWLQINLDTNQFVASIFTRLISNE